MEKKQHHNRKRISSSKRLLLILDGVLLASLLIGLVFLAVTLKKRGSQSLQTTSPIGEQSPQPDPTPDAGIPTVETEPQTEINPAEQEQAAFSNAVSPRSVDFTAYASAKDPVVAYLYCDGTAIDYPVVHGLDNETYMTRNLLGKKDPNGAIYLDCRNSGTLEDAQLILYGNPMADGSMFGSLVSYQDQTYLSQHPTLLLVAPAGSYRIDVFAAHTASPEMSNYPIWFETSESRSTYLDNVKSRSVVTSDLAIPENAQLVCLVTSSDFSAGENARFVVHGILTRL